MEPQDVVLGQTESADGGFIIDTGVRPMPVVSMQPGRQLFLSLARVFIGLGIGPFAQAGLNESLGLAVGLSRIGLGADVPQPEALTGLSEGKGFVARAVVGHHALDLDAETCVIDDRSLLAAKNAKLDLLSGFTTARDLSSGSTADVDLRDAINSGIVEGPRMVVATEGLRGSTTGPRYFHLVDSPWEGRKQVRIQLKNGAGFIKIYVNNLQPTPYGGPTITLEEQQAIVDEAHRQGVKVACTAHAGIAVSQSIEAGCDSLELGIDIDQESIRKIVDKGIFMTFALTINKNASRRTVREIQKASFQRRPARRSFLR